MVQFVQVHLEDLAILESQQVLLVQGFQLDQVFQANHLDLFHQETQANHPFLSIKILINFLKKFVITWRSM